MSLLNNFQFFVIIISTPTLAGIKIMKNEVNRKLLVAVVV